IMSSRPTTAQPGTGADWPPARPSKSLRLATVMTSGYEAGTLNAASMPLLPAATTTTAYSVSVQIAACAGSVAHVDWSPPPPRLMLTTWTSPFIASWVAWSTPHNTCAIDAPPEPPNTLYDRSRAPAAGATT